MAATFTKTYETDLGGGIKMVLGTLAFDNSYPTGGEAVDLSDYFPGGTIHSLVSEVKSSVGYVLGHDGGTATAGKVMAYNGDYDPAAVGPLVEVPNATDLSGITAAKLVILGH